MFDPHPDYWFLPYQWSIHVLDNMYIRALNNSGFYEGYCGRHGIDLNGPDVMGITRDEINELAFEIFDGLSGPAWPTEKTVPSDEILILTSGHFEESWRPEPEGFNRLSCLLAARQVNTMYRIHVYRTVYGMFHYGRREGAGNFTNHPPRHFIYPGHSDYPDE